MDYFMPIGLTRKPRLNNMIASVEHKQYLIDTRLFIEGLVIKFDELGQDINAKLGISDIKLQDKSDRRTWKYYLNMAGEYHSSDKLMTITSLDTLEEIVFNKSNLDLHPYTKLNYKYNSTTYRELVRRYPYQESLIRGIVNPIDLEVAINAKNWSILSYPNDYLEVNEYTLIKDLESFIEGYQTRYYIPAYRLTDMYYVLAHVLVLMSHLPNVLINLRLKRTKTPEVHSYHLNQYLESNGFLSKYCPYLTLEQRLFLYRNIKYIQKHSGETFIHNWLIYQILGKRYIPVSDINYGQLDYSNNSKTMGYAFLSQTKLDKVNTLNIGNIPLNDLIYKEKDLTGTYTDYQLDKIDETLSYPTTNRLSTKILESYLVSSSNGNLPNYKDYVTEQWGYLALTNKYTGYIRIDEARSGDTLTLSVKDAFIWFIYLSYKVSNIELVKMPLVSSIRVFGHSVVDYENLKLSHMSGYDNDELLSIIETEPKLGSINNPLTFSERIKTNYNNYCYNFIRSQAESELDNRAFLRFAAEYPYSHRVIMDKDYIVFKDWIEENRLPNIRYTFDELYLTCKNIYEQATGDIISTVDDIYIIQQVLIKLFLELSSYTIQFIRNHAVSDPLNMGLRGLRLRKPHYSSIKNNYITFRLDARTLYGHTTTINCKQKFKDVSINNSSINKPITLGIVDIVTGFKRQTNVIFKTNVTAVVNVTSNPSILPNFPSSIPGVF